LWNERIAESARVFEEEVLRKRRRKVVENKPCGKQNLRRTKLVENLYSEVKGQCLV
jgi:hypothetical protein